MSDNQTVYNPVRFEVEVKGEYSNSTEWGLEVDGKHHKSYSKHSCDVYLSPGQHKVCARVLDYGRLTKNCHTC